MQIHGLAEDSKYFLKMEVDSNSDIGEAAARNRVAVIKAYEAQYTGDWDTWWNLFDPDVEFQEAASLPYGTSVKGIEAAKQGVAGLFATWKELDMTIHEFVAGGDIVIAYLRLKATSRKTGKVYEGDTAEFFRFRGGKVVEWKAIYWDTHRVREVCGLI
jgi:ketosteroid isomerase-like protein